MAQNRRKFLGPNAGTIREPTSNEKRHGRVANPPRFMEMGGFSSKDKAMKKNDKSLATVAGSVE